MFQSPKEKLEIRNTYLAKDFLDDFLGLVQSLTGGCQVSSYNHKLHGFWDEGISLVKAFKLFFVTTGIATKAAIQDWTQTGDGSEPGATVIASLAFDLITKTKLIIVLAALQVPWVAKETYSKKILKVPNGLGTPRMSNKMYFPMFAPTSRYSIRVS